MIEARIVEIPEQMWEIDIFGYAWSQNLDGYETAGEALDYLTTKYPNDEIQVEVISISAHNKLLMEGDVREKK